MNTTANICWKVLYKLDESSLSQLSGLFNFSSSHGFIRSWGGISDFSFSPQTLIPTSRFYDLLKPIKFELGFSERKFPFSYTCKNNRHTQLINFSFRLYGSVLTLNLELKEYQWLGNSRLRGLSDLASHGQVSKLLSVVLALVERGRSGSARPSQDPRVYPCIQIKRPAGVEIDEVELIEALTGHVQPTPLVLNDIYEKNKQLQIDASSIYLDRQGVVASIPELYWDDKTVRRRFTAACGMLEALSSIQYLDEKNALMHLSHEQRISIHKLLEKPRKRFAHSLSSFYMWQLLCSEFNMDKSDFEHLISSNKPPLALNTKMKKILVVSALDTEVAPFVKKCSLVTTHKIGGFYVTVGSYQGANYGATIYLFSVDVGNTSAALNTQAIVSAIKPDLVVFSGIAGGRKAAKIGDVVIANHVYNYESAKEEHPKGKSGVKLTPRPREITLSQSARSLTEAFMIQLDRAALGFDVYRKPIACGEKVVASNLGASASLISQVYSDSYAIEMEGYGFLSALHSLQIDGVLIRGISDLLENKDQDENHELAIQNSANICFRLIEFYLAINDGDAV